MTPTERLRDLVSGLPIRESNGSASVILPDGSLVEALGDGTVYVYLYRGGAVCGVTKIDDFDAFRANQSSATACKGA